MGNHWGCQGYFAGWGIDILTRQIIGFIGVSILLSDIIDRIFGVWVTDIDMINSLAGNSLIRK